MKMGVEKVLNEHFEDLGEVIALNAKTAPPRVTMVTVMKQLENLVPVITALGGKVLVQDVNSEEGIIYLAYTGPFRLKKGIELIIKEDPAVSQIIFEEIPTQSATTTTTEPPNPTATS